MKRRYLVLFAIISNLLSIETYSQCSTIPALTSVEVVPSASQLNCVIRNSFYDETIRIRFQESVVLVGAPSVNIDSILITSITGLPTGINYIIPASAIPSGNTTCIRFYGQTNDLAGNYTIQLSGTIFSSIGPVSGIFDNTVPGGLLPMTGYSIEVVNQGQPCKPFIVTLGDDGYICSDTTYSITMSPAFSGIYSLPFSYDYTISSGSLSCYSCDTPTASFTSPTIITLTVTDNQGRIASDTLTYSKLASIFANDGLGIPNLCQGDSIKLSVLSAVAPFTLTTLVWNTGSQSSTIWAKSTGLYSFTGSFISPIPTVLPSCSTIKDSIYINFNSLPTPQIQVSDTLICRGDEITLSALGGVNFNWSNGVTSASQQIQPAYTSNYSVTVTDANGCTATADTNVFVKQPYNGEQVCVVTVDTANGRNLIIWEKTRGENTAWFKIYKQNSVTSQYDSIGIVHIDSFSVFTDYNSNPNQQSASYTLSVVDSCGNESYQSSTHTTIHLSANQGINGQVNLQWNAYDGFSYTNFEIYRSNNGGAFTQIGSVANSSLSYTDLTPPSGTNYYYVAVTKPGGCSPSRSITKTQSNILDGQGNPVTLSIDGINANLVKVYPNPSNGRYNIIGDDIESIDLFDALGKKVIVIQNNANNLLDISQLPQGIYTLKVKLQGTIQSVRLVKD